MRYFKKRCLLLVFAQDWCHTGDNVAMDQVVYFPAIRVFIDQVIQCRNSLVLDAFWRFFHDSR